MNRIKDYSGFAAWFLGLGYLVLWPITADAAPALRLPPGLHALGFMSALYVAARVLADAVRRSRRASLSATSAARKSVV